MRHNKSGVGLVGCMFWFGITACALRLASPLSRSHVFGQPLPFPARGLRLYDVRDLQVDIDFQHHWSASSPTISPSSSLSSELVLAVP